MQADNLEQAFAAYVKFKRLPVNKGEPRYQAMFEQFRERERLAAAILSEGRLDRAMLDAELNEFRKEMVISRYFDEHLGDKVTDTEIKNYYNTHAGDYEERKVHVAHILFRTRKDMDQVARQAQLTAAQDAASRIRAGEKFAEVAAAVSEDKVSARKGGDLGWIKQGAIDPRFSAVAFSTDPGAVYPKTTKRLSC